MDSGHFQNMCASPSVSCKGLEILAVVTRLPKGALLIIKGAPKVGIGHNSKQRHDQHMTALYEYNNRVHSSYYAQPAKNQ